MASEIIDLKNICFVELKPMPRPLIYLFIGLCIPILMWKSVWCRLFHDRENWFTTFTPEGEIDQGYARCDLCGSKHKVSS